MQKLKDIGLDDNTIILFTTDNGTEVFTWPDGGQTPFAQSKGTVMEGGFRVPCIIRWPGQIKPGTVENGIFSGLDWFPTLMAAAGNPDITNQLLKGVKLGERTYKNHLDGYNQLDMLTNPNGKSQRHEFFYFGETDLNAVRVDQWKIHVATKDKWLEAATKIPGGLVIDIKADPYERSPETGGHFLWMKEKTWILPIFAPYLQAFAQSLQDFPPAQKGTGIGAASIVNSLKDKPPED